MTTSEDPARAPPLAPLCPPICGPARLSSDVSEIKLVFSIPPHRPTPNIARTGNGRLSAGCRRNIEMTPLCKIEETHPRVLGTREVRRGGVVDEQAGVQPS